MSDDGGSRAALGPGAATMDDLLDPTSIGIATMRSRLARLDTSNPPSSDERVELHAMYTSVRDALRELERTARQDGRVSGDRLRSTTSDFDEITATMARLQLLTPDASPGRRTGLVHRFRYRVQRLATTPPAQGPAETTPALRPATSRERWLMIAGRALTALGVVLVLFVLYEFWGTDIAEIRSQRHLGQTFREQLAAQSGFTDEGLPLPGTPVALLRIPKLDLEKVVVEGTSPQLLKQGPGHFRNTPLPGQVGNSVIAGRRTTYGAPFASLGSLAVGDEILVTTAQGTFRYVVGATGTVDPGELDVVASSSDNRLTLVTSNPVLLASGRIGVMATLEEEGLAAPILVHPTTLDGDETALAGDIGGLPGVIVVGELLAVVLALGLTLYRRWNRRVVYILTAPIVIALLFLMFENLDRLLPGSL